MHHYQLTTASYAVAQSSSLQSEYPLSCSVFSATFSVFLFPQVPPPMSHIGELRSLDCGAYLSALNVAKSSASLAAAH
jgi:hypothetical protein